MDGFAVRAADVPASCRCVSRVAAGSAPAWPASCGLRRDLDRRDGAGWSRRGRPGRGGRGPRDGVAIAGRGVAAASTSDRAAGTCAKETSWSRRASGSARADRRARRLRDRRGRLLCAAPGGRARDGAASSAPRRALAAGQIYESNRAMIAAVALARSARTSSCCPSSEDDEVPIVPRSSRGLEADVLVTSGGVSMGEHDLVRRVASSSACARSSGASP